MSTFFSGGFRPKKRWINGLLPERDNKIERHLDWSMELEVRDVSQGLPKRWDLI